MSLFMSLLVITVGYSAFNTNLTLNTKGNIGKKVLINDFIVSLYNENDINLIDDNTSDHNIRYSGGDVNNYVCLKNETNCSADNLYRIIGVFNNIKQNDTSIGETRVKLIRANVSGVSTYDDNNIANFAKPSTLNILLNSSDLINSPFIQSAVWHLGYSWINSLPATSYINERSNQTLNSYPSTYVSKIALMYQSDYGFASKACYASKKFWVPYDENSNDYSLEECKNSNWLYLNTREWTLTPSYRTDLDYNTIDFIVESGQIVDAGSAYPSDYHNYRPVFYLKKDTYILDNGNNGSKEKPYILAN